MGLPEKAKKAIEEGDEGAEERATALEGLAAGAGPAGVAAESLQHELDRAVAAQRAQEEEHRKSEAGGREEIRKLAAPLEAARGDLGNKDSEINDLQIELAKARAVAKQNQVDLEHRAEVAE